MVVSEPLTSDSDRVGEAADSVWPAAGAEVAVFCVVVESDEVTPGVETGTFSLEVESDEAEDDGVVEAV